MSAFFFAHACGLAGSREPNPQMVLASRLRSLAGMKEAAELPLWCQRRCPGCEPVLPACIKSGDALAVGQSSCRRTRSHEKMLTHHRKV